MKRLRPLLCAALALCCLPMLASCASDEDESPASYSHRLREKNDKYYEKQEKRKMKLRARQKRVDMWYESLMN
ncbi:hypothetical protein DES53_108121 [Roseimicrobium gellanilyticum]|uniref:Lipoprotein n=1 Tax=Roseimicrobium gellanilyticum TaxID=748857 RepID=A0A366HFD4_9BACT|nr:hypothetical protein [Roseimicrobium gellanilyticum]RBP40414.1 hypothetical protein DES53_108121 [Roseimicrobium gellanilyticum]